MSIAAHLAETYLSDFSEEAVRILEQRPTQEVAELLRASQPTVAARLCALTLPFNGAQWLMSLSDQAASAIIAHMDHECIIRTLRHIPAERREALLLHLSDEDRGQYRRLLCYGNHQVGGHMEPVFTALREDLRLDRAQERARQHGTAALAFPYVVDSDQHLVGILGIRAVMTAAPDKLLKDIMVRNVTSLTARMDLAEARSLPFWQQLEVLPVVDKNGVLLGSIRCRAVDMADHYMPANNTAPLVDAAFSLATLYVDNLSRFIPDMVSLSGSMFVTVEPNRSDDGKPD